MKLKEAVTHPFTALGAFGAALAQGLGFLDPILAGVAGTASLWFPVLSGLWRLGELVEAVPTALFRDLFIGGLVVYVSIYALRFLQRVISRFKEDS